jgi:hypothetical protein
MFEDQYNDEMTAEVKRLEAKSRALAAGNPHWNNACSTCGCELAAIDTAVCESCRREQD